jgi:hypothetical protein
VFVRMRGVAVLGRVAVLMSVRVGMGMLVFLPMMMARTMFVFMVVKVRVLLFVMMSTDTDRVLSGQTATAISTHCLISSEVSLPVFAVQFLDRCSSLNFQ